MLKIYWAFDKVRIKTKKLKNVSAIGNAILPVNAWDDDDGFYFSEVVGHNPFTPKIIASDGRMEIILNDNESVRYDDIHIEKWSVFENYFKVGNYFNTRDKGANAKVKLYELEVSH